jgi:signal transduction histidine kinase
VLSQFVLEHLPDPLVVLNAEGGVLEVNRAARESEHCDLPALFNPDHRDPSVSHFLTEFLTDLRVNGRASRELPNQVTSHPVGRISLDGTAVGSCFVVTLQQRVDSAILAQRLKHAHRVEALGLMTARIVHDLNNLLTPILLLSRDLAEELEQGGLRGTLARDIESAAARAASLVKNVLAYARPRAARMEVVTLNSVVSSVRPLVELLTGGDVRLVLSLDPRPGQVSVDRAHLEQTVLNLVANACHAMPGGGQITITTANVTIGHPEAEAPFASYVVLMVDDTGIGMTEDVRSRAFDDFFTTRAAGGGTGLGLASVRQFVTESGGILTLNSEVGRGTSVVIHLPRVQRSAPRGRSLP